MKRTARQRKAKEKQTDNKNASKTSPKKKSQKDFKKDEKKESPKRIAAKKSEKAKIIVELAGVQKVYGYIKNNLQTFYVQKKKERRNQERESHGTGDLWGLLTGVFLLFMVVFISIIHLAVSTGPASLVFLFPAAMEMLTPKEMTIVDVAENEYAQADDTVGGQKYKDWYGLNGNWCAMFVSYCANECGYIESGIMPKTASVRSMMEWYKKRGQWVDAKDYEPKAGDIIFFTNNASHVGIVVDFDTSKKIIYTIEGNSGTSSATVYHEGSHVKKGKYTTRYAKISGYGLPDYPVVME